MTNKMYWRIKYVMKQLRAVAFITRCAVVYLCNDSKRRGSADTLCLYMKRTLVLQDELKKLPELYHPVDVHGFRHLVPKRSCVDRLNCIISDMHSSPGSITDIGCQIGYFSFSLSDLGYDVKAYDMINRHIKICRLISKLRIASSTPLFHKLKLTPETVQELSASDYTICLAVFHHIIYEFGIQAAQQMADAIRAKTKKTFYFEIGQTNEPHMHWSDSLPQMGATPFNWIEDFLINAGFKKVRLLGTFPTHLSDVNRILVAADSN